MWKTNPFCSLMLYYYLCYTSIKASNVPWPQTWQVVQHYMTPCLLQYKTRTPWRGEKNPDYCLRRFFAPDDSPDKRYDQPHPAFLLIYYRGTSLLIYKARHYLCIKLALTYVQALTQLRYTRQPIPRSLGTGGRERDYCLLSLTVKWRISGASHSMATPRVTCSRRS